MNKVKLASNNICQRLEHNKKLKFKIDYECAGLIRIKVGNIYNDFTKNIIIGDNIIINVDDAVYFDLDDYNKAIDFFEDKLENLVAIQIHTNDDRILQFYTEKKTPQELINETTQILNEDPEFMDMAQKISVNNFYGDIAFEAEKKGRNFKLVSKNSR